MNAVVGLAELAGMKEGVPDNVRELLSKLRISSHYLLDLINDILDMSRLDSGMLTIAAESFSLDKMLGELQLMMETGRKKTRTRLQNGKGHRSRRSDRGRGAFASGAHQSPLQCV